MVVKPKFDFSILPAIAGVLSSIFAGAAYTMLRFLRNYEKPIVVVFYFSFFSLIAMFPLMMMNFQMPNFIEFLYLIGTGVFAAIGQFSITYAYRFTEASKVSIFNYTSIIFAAIIGFLIWGELSDNWSFLGGFVIIGISVYLFFTERKINLNLK